MASNARGEILGRVRAANSRANGQIVAQAWAELPRLYTRSSNRSRASVLELLKERLRDYDARVVEAEESHVATAIGEILAGRGVSRMLVPESFDSRFLPEGLRLVPASGLSALEMDEIGGIISESSLAIAETGTIVLQHGAGQGARAATLVPDYHLCLVRASSVVATVPEAFDALRATGNLPTTFISGPSATADIEMTRIKGVHGPRSLDVLLILPNPAENYALDNE